MIIIQQYQARQRQKRGIPSNIMWIANMVLPEVQTMARPIYRPTTMELKTQQAW